MSEYVEKFGFKGQNLKKSHIMSKLGLKVSIFQYRRRNYINVIFFPNNLIF